jgi:ferric-dicitrate binding protein FerR (iron transport regulator)
MFAIEFKSGPCSAWKRASFDRIYQTEAQARAVLEEMESYGGCVGRVRPIKPTGIGQTTLEDRIFNSY